MGDVIRGFGSWCERGGMHMERGARAGQVFRFINAQSDMSVTVTGAREPLDLGTLQSFLDEWLHIKSDVTIDYVHGEDSVRRICAQSGACGILLRPIDKSDLFSAVERRGALPRKTFSMGEAREKRYYLECRKIVE